MTIFKKLFKRKFDHYPYKIVDLDDGDAHIIFSDRKLNYILDLDWGGGVMDIEFGLRDFSFHDTTNTHNQYKILKTISYITRLMASRVTNKTGIEFHTVTFKSSNWRDGDIDLRSGEIRNRFFARYVIKEYPNAEVSTGKNNSLIIKLNNI